MPGGIRDVGASCHFPDDFLVPEEGLRSKIFQYFDNLGAWDASMRR